MTLDEPEFMRALRERAEAAGLKGAAWFIADATWDGKHAAVFGLRGSLNGRGAECETVLGLGAIADAIEELERRRAGAHG